MSAEYRRHFAVISALRADQPPLSLQYYDYGGRPVSEKESRRPGTRLVEDQIPDPTQDPERIVDSGLLKDTLSDVLSTLTPRNRQVIILRFGFETGEALTWQEVGDRMGFTVAEVRNREAQAFRCLRQPQNFRRLRDFLDLLRE